MSIFGFGDICKITGAFVSGVHLQFCKLHFKTWYILRWWTFWFLGHGLKDVELRNQGSFKWSWGTYYLTEMLQSKKQALIYWQLHLMHNKLYKWQKRSSRHWKPRYIWAYSSPLITLREKCSNPTASMVEVMGSQVGLSGSALTLNFL